jgi:hypothetical protein
MNTLALYWNQSKWMWDTQGALATGLLKIPKRSLLELDIIAKGQDLSAMSTNGLFSFKTVADLASGGDFTFAQAGFDTLSANHSPSTGKLAIPFVVPGSKTITNYVGGVTLYNATNQPTQYAPFYVRLLQSASIGDEATTPVSIADPLSGDVIISGSNTTSVVTVTDFTTTGMALVVQEGLSSDADWAGPVVPWVTLGTGQFTINVPAAPEIVSGDGRKFYLSWYIVRKSS